VVPRGWKRAFLGLADEAKEKNGNTLLIKEKKKKEKKDAA